ncbi:hypothetical protein QCA50_020826 [Cerrena zonata]|uniref:HTH La-type RNA-binding domain-containing protein n=1 Tax=Cerrena zonata TaxID=2478898 RepID=A0AAW0FHX3_9APHY
MPPLQHVHPAAAAAAAAAAMNPQLAYGVHPLHQQPPIQIPPPISPKQDPQQALTQQIDYYFSLENLIRDIYLRKNMDLTEGWEVHQNLGKLEDK